MLFSRSRRTAPRAAEVHRQRYQSACRGMGEGRHLPGARAVQEARRPRLSRAQQAGRIRRAGARLLLRADDGRGARRHQLRRRADGDRRADRHGDAGAGAVRLRRAAQGISRALDRRRLSSPASACPSPAPAPTSPRSRPRAKSDGDDYVINGGKMWITNGTQADWICLLVQHRRRPGPPQQVADLRADEDQGREHRAQARQARHALVRHRADLLRRGAGAEAQPDRRGGQGLHLPDGAVPGGAAVGRGRLPQGAREDRSRTPSSTPAAARRSASRCSTIR